MNEASREDRQGAEEGWGGEGSRKYEPCLSSAQSQQRPPLKVVAQLNEGLLWLYQKHPKSGKLLNYIPLPAVITTRTERHVLKRRWFTDPMVNRSSLWD